MRTKKKDLDYTTIEEYLVYDEKSPTFIVWKKDYITKKGQKYKYSKGDVAGSKHHTGYVYVTLLGETYSVHRVVMVLNGIYVTKNQEVDHIDTNRENNRIQNLRIVDVILNNRNHPKQKNNKTGVTGVYSQGGARFITQWVNSDGKQTSKSFNFKKYGYDEAFRLACEWRTEQIRLLNEQGAGYTERHGK